MLYMIRSIHGKHTYVHMHAVLLSLVSPQSRTAQAMSRMPYRTLEHTSRAQRRSRVPSQGARP